MPVLPNVTRTSAARGGLPVGNQPANVDMGPDVPPMRFDATPNVSRVPGKAPAPGETPPPRDAMDMIRRAAMRRMGFT